MNPNDMRRVLGYMPGGRDNSDDLVDALRYIWEGRRTHRSEEYDRAYEQLHESLYKEIMLRFKNNDGIFTTQPNPAEVFVAKPISELTGEELEERIRTIKRELKYERNYNASAHLGRQLTELNTEKNKRKILHAKELARSEHALDDFLGGFKIN